MFISYGGKFSHWVSIELSDRFELSDKSFKNDSF